MAQVDTRLPLWAAGCLALLAGCAASPTDGAELAINELMSDNDAAWLDEAGQVEDWVEIVNRSGHAVQLADYRLRDGRGHSFDFPQQSLAAAERVVVFADGDLDQGPLHADFKLDAQGDTLELVERATGRLLDRVQAPALGLNDTYARFPDAHGAFSICRYASPERSNGTRCDPAPPPEPPEEARWPAFTWPSDWPASRGPLVLSELALKPARFIEVANIGSAPVELRDYALRVSPIAPGESWPDQTAGTQIAWGAHEQLAPGARIALPVDDSDLSRLAADPAFEGVVTIFDAAGSSIDRVDFMRWPEGASLARSDDRKQQLRFCAQPSEGRPNDACQPLASREVGDRLRHLYTPGDYAALAVGETNLGSSGVKFIVDLAAGGVVHFLSTRDWALHFTFIREQIDHAAPLDRCDAAQSQAFDQGWYEFSEREYFRSAGRRYLLGTLSTYAGSGLKVCEYALGDEIVAEQMQQGFLSAASHMDAEPLQPWSVHPVEPRQSSELAKLAGRLPVVPSNEPFRNLRYQPLTEGVAYGVLRFVPAAELEQASLGPEVLAITDAVPNDLPLVGGLITEAFQTPLAHVNVLSQNRGTPNMALRDARQAAQVAPFIGKLCRLEVTGQGFEIRSATGSEADAFRQSHQPSGPRQMPRLDLSVRGPVDLAGRGLADLPSIGAKAAQLAELGHIVVADPACPGAIPTPSTPFAIPLSHYVDHFARSGAKAQLEAAQQDSQFRGDPVHRAAVLAQIRDTIQSSEVDPELLAQVESAIAERFGHDRVRLRSSSNTEDLPGFNGAGLYESWSAALDDPERPIADALRSVWASLWLARAYDEREFGNIDQSGVAMGVLVHPAFLSERANVIVISRDVLDPTRSDIHYMNAQAGEASVANPAPGVGTEQLIHHWRTIPGTPEVEYKSASTLTHGQQVLSLADARAISCYVAAVHDHFQALLDPAHENRWFAMDMELKLVGDARAVVIKQARPYRFGRSERPSDCREF
jgi:hypothetical protein